MDIVRGEMVEKELDAMIERRSLQKDPQEDSDVWQESVERYNAERDRQLRTEWTEYHQGQAERHKVVLKGLIAHHEEQAEKYLPKGA